MPSVAGHLLMKNQTSYNLDSRVEDFLKIYCVGIDFGDAAGGIAVVRGNEILQIEWSN